MVQSLGRRGFAIIMECVSRLCRHLVLVWDTKTRQKHLFAMRGLDGAGQCCDHGSYHLQVT